MKREFNHYNLKTQLKSAFRASKTFDYQTHGSKVLRKHLEWLLFSTYVSYY